MFGDVLFVADPPVLSSVGGDLWREFIFWRDFGFSELGQGNLAKAVAVRFRLWLRKWV